MPYNSDNFAKFAIGLANAMSEHIEISGSFVLILRMKPIIQKVCTVIGLLCAAITVYPSDFTVGPLNYDIVSLKDRVAIPIELNTAVETLDIPFNVEYEGLTFTVPVLDEINPLPWGEDYRSGVKRVILHEGLTQINNAFDSFESLEDVNIPVSVKVLGAAFSNCVSLKSFTIPENIESIEGGLFSGCTNLKSVSFEGTPKFTYVFSFDNSIHATGGVFNNCTSLENIELPSSLNHVGNGFFRGCTNLKQVKMSDNCISIGEECFADCISLAEFVFPSHLESVGEYAFKNCGIAGDITIPNTVRYIGTGAFTGCKQIKSFCFPDNCSLLVDSNSLSGCENLQSITIPNNGGTFKGRVTDSPLLDELISLNYFPPVIESDFLSTSSLLKTHLKIRDNAYSNYSESSTWGNFLHIDKEYDGLGIYDICFNFYIPDIYKSAFDVYYPEKNIKVMEGNSALINVSYTSAGFSWNSEFVPYYNDIQIPTSATIIELYWANLDWINRNDSETAQRYFMTPPVYKNTEFCIKYNEDASIGSIDYEEDETHDIEIYSLDGIKINKALNDLQRGMYIIRQGHVSNKILIQ